MLAWGAGFAASWRPPRVALDQRLTDDDVTWLNGQLELVDKPTVRFAREIALPYGPASGYMPAEMAHGYVPPSISLQLPAERIR